MIGSFVNENKPGEVMNIESDDVIIEEFIGLHPDSHLQRQA